jgi:protein-disulfide isomerase
MRRITLVGVEAGVRGTPAFVIGRTVPSSTVTGEMVIGVQSFEAIRAKIDSLTTR